MTTEQAEIAFFSALGMAVTLLLALGHYYSWWAVAGVAAFGLLVLFLVAFGTRPAGPGDDGTPY